MKYFVVTTDMPVAFIAYAAGSFWFSMDEEAFRAHEDKLYKGSMVPDNGYRLYGDRKGAEAQARVYGRDRFVRFDKMGAFADLEEFG